MLTIFTFPTYPSKNISNDNVAKLKHFNFTVKDNEGYDYGCCQIQYDGYCYYIHSNNYKSFIVTMETGEYIMGDLFGLTTHQLIYHKNKNKWSRMSHGREFINSTTEEMFFNQIKGVLYVMQYRRMMTNIYYLLKNMDIISDIHTHINTMILDTFAKDTFVII